MYSQLLKIKVENESIELIQDDDVQFILDALSNAREQLM